MKIEMNNDVVLKISEHRAAPRNDTVRSQPRYTFDCGTPYDDPSGSGRDTHEKSNPSQEWPDGLYLDTESLVQRANEQYEQILALQQRIRELESQ